jgi:hypothetical protein
VLWPAEEASMPGVEDLGVAAAVYISILITS